MISNPKIEYNPWEAYIIYLRLLWKRDKKKYQKEAKELYKKGNKTGYKAIRGYAQTKIKELKKRTKKITIRENLWNMELMETVWVLDRLAKFTFKHKKLAKKYGKS